jgi:hypothetical protein
LAQPFDWTEHAGGKEIAISKQYVKAQDKQQASSSVEEKPKLDRKLYSKLYRDIDRVDTWVNTASNNGLFHEQTNVSYKNVQDELDKARKNLQMNNYSDSVYHISLAVDAFSRALYSARRRWRFSNIYAGGILIYLVAFLIGIFAFYSLGGYSNILDNMLANTVGTEYYETAVHAVVWGCVGSILREFWYLKDKIDDRNYNNAWRVYLILGPFIGAIFGAIIYFLIVGGLLSLTGQTEVHLINPLIIIPFALLAGFNWEWGVEIFKKIGDIISPGGS